jgi:hypothetical protein
MNPRLQLRQGEPAPTTGPKSKLRPKVGVRQCFFSKFADGVRVASIPRQIQTDFVKLGDIISRNS